MSNKLGLYVCISDNIRFWFSKDWSPIALYASVVQKHQVKVKGYNLNKRCSSQIVLTFAHLWFPQKIPSHIIILFDKGMNVQKKTSNLKSLRPGKKRRYTSFFLEVMSTGGIGEPRPPPNIWIEEIQPSFQQSVFVVFLVFTSDCVLVILEAICAE